MYDIDDDMKIQNKLGSKTSQVLNKYWTIGARQIWYDRRNVNMVKLAQSLRRRDYIFQITYMSYHSWMRCMQFARGTKMVYMDCVIWYWINGMLMVTLLEALPVDDGWTGLVVFLFADPHLLEGGKWGEDGTSDPHGVFPFWWSNDLNFHGARSECGDFFLHTVGDTWVHRGTSGQYRVCVQVFTNIDITFHDAIVCGFVDTGGFHTQKWGLEHGLGTPKSLVSDRDDLSVGQFVALFERWRGCGCCHFLFEV